MRRAVTSVVLGTLGCVIALGIGLIALLLGAAQLAPYGVGAFLEVMRNTVAVLGGFLSPVLFLLAIIGLVKGLRADGSRRMIVTGITMNAITLLAVAGIVVAAIFRGGISL